MHKQIIWSALLLWSGLVWAGLRLPAIIGDNMVLQQDADVPIWGWATPGEKVSVTFGVQKATAVADAKGKWTARLSGLKAGGPYEMTIEAERKITLKNILVGEVWLCSGQSNMKANLGWISGAAAVAQANDPEIHLFLARMWLSPQPMEDTQGQWVVCSPQTVGAFSAVGYYFGRDIQQALKVPVGLIDTSSGGTTAQTWISTEAFKGHENLGGPADLASPRVIAFYERLKAFEQAMDQWQKDVQEAKAGNTRPPPQPVSPLVGSGYPPCGTYNAQIAPLLPYAIRGVTWYQGEANTFNPGRYAALMRLLIADWRRVFGRPEMPFLFVQLPNFIPDNVPPGAWAALREAQLQATDVPHVAMVVTIDVGDAKDIHPRNKKPVGQRLALAALDKVYGRKIVSSGPLYEAMSIEGGRVHLAFRELGGGLATGDGQELTGFAIAGADRHFVPAHAEIQGRGIIVSSDQVPEPKAVRYAWADNPTCNLVNKEGLPASPFRTDDWR